MTLEDMYNLAKDINKDQQLINKYLWAGYNKLLDVRYFDVNDTFTVQTPINDYVKKYGSIMIFPNIVNGKIVDLSIRTVEQKKVLTYKIVDLPFGVGTLRDDFKYGDPLFLVEGVGDYCALKFIDKNIDVVAMMGNSVAKDMYETYASITNNIILLADNDESGRQTINSIEKRFRKLSVNVEVIPQFDTMKDTGDILDNIVEYQKTKSQDLKEYIALAVKYYQSQINLHK